MAIFTLTLAADEAREAAITGNYFELRNALEAVAKIELLDRSGGIVGLLENPEQSDFVQTERPYETVRITNGAVAQTVKHFYGHGVAGSRRTSGQVQVEGTVDVMGDVSVVDVVGSACRHYFRNAAVPVAVTVTNIVTAVANTNGVYLRGYSLTPFAPAAAVTRAAYFAGPTAPTDFASATDRYCIGAVICNAPAGATRSDQVSNHALTRKLPAGWGIWLVEQAIGSAGENTALLEYEIAP